MRLMSMVLSVAALLIGVAVHAQVPIDPPPLPETSRAAGSNKVLPLSVTEAPPTTSGAACVPGHCNHRTAIGRRRCKRHLQEVFLGFPEEFERPPLGAMTRAINAVAIGNAEAAAMIVRPYDFEAGTAKLNIRGGDKLREIAMRLPTSFAPVIIERSRDASLDQSRRASVLAALSSGPFPIPAERVIIGPSLTPGLGGMEALLINNTELMRTELTGPPVGIDVAPSSPAEQR